MWKEAVAAWFVLLSRNFTGWLRKTKKYLSQSSQYQHWVSKDSVLDLQSEFVAHAKDKDLYSRKYLLNQYEHTEFIFDSRTFYVTFTRITCFMLIKYSG
jgi:hypothetical protein